jgi:hypothetical protein
MHFRGIMFKIFSTDELEPTCIHQEDALGKGGGSSTACSASTGSDREICTQERPSPNLATSL